MVNLNGWLLPSGAISVGRVGYHWSLSVKLAKINLIRTKTISDKLSDWTFIFLYQTSKPQEMITIILIQGLKRKYKGWVKTTHYFFCEKGGMVDQC